MQAASGEAPSERYLQYRWPRTTCVGLTSLSYFALARFSLLFVVQPENVAGFWLPNGLLIGVLVLRTWRDWRWLLTGAGVANLFANLSTGNSVGISLGFAAANVLESWLAAQLLVGYAGTAITLQRLKEVVGLVVVAAIPACGCGAVLCACLISFSSGDVGFAAVWRVWFVADLLGLLLMAPLVIAWNTSAAIVWRVMPRARWIESAVLLVLLVAAALLIARQSPESVGSMFMRPYVVVPFLLWATMRFGGWGSSTVTLVVALIAIWHAAHGLGQFSHSGNLVTIQLLAAQTLLLVVVITTLVMQAVLEERSRAREQLDLVIQGTDAGIWDWNILTNEVYQSPRWKRMLGFEDHELAAGFDTWESRIHPEDHSRALATFRDYLSGKLPRYELEHRLRHRTGEYIWVLSRGIVVRDSAGRPLRVAGSHLDITALKAAESALRASERNFKVAFDNSPIGMDIIDLQGRYVRVNESYCRMIGYPSSQLIGKPIRSVTHPDDVASDQESLRRFLDGEMRTYQTEKRFLHSDGRVVWALLNVTMVRDSNDRPLHFFGQIQDITQLKHDEEELRQQALELKRSNQELDDFAYIASHDLKTPLRGIENLSKWIAEDSQDVLSEGSREHLRKLRQRIARLDRLLDDLLQFSRAGRMTGDVSQINTGPLVLSVVELLNPPPGFVVVLTSDMPTLTTHKTPLELVFRNLIDNAVKHHHRADGRIEVSAVVRNRVVEFTVRDDGPGIPAEYHEHIFRMFQTLKPRDELEASGIGLAVVKKVVERHGGQITVESSDGQGTSFRFTWPRLIVQRGRHHA